MKLHTINEIAEVLDQTSRSVRYLIGDGRLAAVKVGGSIRVTGEEFDRFLRDLPPAQLAPRKRRPHADREVTVTSDRSDAALAA